MNAFSIDDDDDIGYHRHQYKMHSFDVIYEFIL